MAAGRGKPRARIRELLEEGLRLAKGGMPDKAISSYREARDLGDDPEVAAEAARREAHAQQARGRWAEALEAARESARISQELGRSDLLAEALNAEAAVHYARGAFDEALALFERMLELTDHPRIRGLALQNLGIIHGRQGELELAERRLAEAFEAFERTGYEWGQAHVLNNRVGVALERKDYAPARELAHRAMAMARKVDDMDLLAVVMLNYAEVLTGLGELDRAEEEASTALGYFESAGNHWRRVGCYQLLGDVNERRGETELARRLWSDALELARELGASADAAQLEARLGATS